MSTFPAMIDWTDPAIWSPAKFAELARAGDEHWAALEPGPRVLIVAHDAGGAEMVGAWLQRRLALASQGRTGRLEPVLHVTGPARKVFARLGLMNYPEALAESPMGTGRAFDWVLSGTGWSTPHEKSALRDAIALKVPTVAYLDHWTNYPDRFLLGAKTFHPVYLWAGDPGAERLARAYFQGESQILLMPSAYFAAIRRDYEQAPRVPATSPRRYLYVTEPISSSAKAHFGDERWYGYTEYEALENFLRFIASSKPEEVCVRLRPHPAESPDKYDAITKRHLFVQLASLENSLSEDCTWADAVVGCNTMAMVIGWLCGRMILCSIPPTGPECDLALPGIRRLFPRENPSSSPGA